jgi:hypothetical protein
MMATVVLVMVLVLATQYPALVCGIQGKFYVYQWPDKLSNVFPDPSKVLHKWTSYDHDFYPNGGAGKLVHEDLGIYRTWQFSLFRVLYNRLLQSKHRTM